MKKNYIQLYVCLIILITASGLHSQTCTVPAPSITGNTLAACTTSNSFTITANSASSLTVGWYTASFGGNAVSNNSVFTTPTLTNSVTYYVGAASTATTSSISLPAFVNGYTGNTRGMWFTAPVSFVITGLRVPTDVGTGNTSIAVMKFGSNPPAYSTTTNSFNMLYFAQNLAGVGIIPVYIPVYAGDIIGILGCRGNTTSYGTTGPFTASLGSSTLALNRLGMQYQLSGTYPQDIWTEAASIGRIEVYTSMGCLSPLTPVTVSVVPNPVISILGPPGSICANSTTTLTASGLQTYTWASGATTSTLAVTPGVTTTYSVAGSMGSSCSTVAAITVSVDTSPPTLSISATTNSVCFGSTVSLTGSGNQTYTWTGGISNAVAFTPTATNVYTLTGGNGCGISSAVTTVTVHPNPALVTSATSSVICNGDVTTLNATGATNYTWSPGNVTGTTMTVAPNAPTAYSLTGTNIYGCVSSTQQVIVVNPTPTVNAIASHPIVCSAGTSSLLASGSANSYSWNTGATAPAVVVNPTVTTTYTVTGMYTATGCTLNNMVTVSVFIPTLSISPSASVCMGKGVILTAGPALSYTWSNNSPFSSITVTPAIQTIYTASATINNGGNVNCVGSNSVQVDVMPNPTVNVTATKTVICKGESTKLTATGANSFSWNTTATTSSISVSPIFPLNTYTVTGTDLNGCSAVTTIQIKVNTCSGIEEWASRNALVSVYPNPSNGEFIIQSESNIELQLINELGQLINNISLNEMNDHKVSVTGIANGIYFITGINDNRFLKEKIIVAK